MKIGLVIHLPHVSTIIPGEYLESIILSERELEQEIIWATDAYCDELFNINFGVRVIAPFSRLVCDVERFRDDSIEPCAQSGNGFFYTNTQRGKKLRNENSYLKFKAVTQIYDQHHEALNSVVDKILNEHEQCLIIDGHSFCDDRFVGNDLPDFCIGTDNYHTSDILAETATGFLNSSGYKTEINRPYSGSIVPMKYYLKNKRVHSLMIEVNKRLYLKNGSLDKSKDFLKIKSVCEEIIKLLVEVFI